MQPVIIVGCGYVGERLAAVHRARGDAVTALVRSDTRAEALSRQGIEVVHGDLDAPASLPPLPAAGALVYYLAPPPRRGDTDPRLAAFVNQIAGGPLRRLIYMSTTGVYGDCAGAWVDEDRPLNPTSDRGRRRAAAEAVAQAYGLDKGVEVVVLRVAGIYGPGRLPLQRLRDGEPVVRAADAPYSNRIHVDDLVSACMAAAERGRPGRVYNIADGHPTSSQDYLERVADLVSLPRPPAISMEEARGRLRPMQLSFLEESRRIDVHRMIDELGVTLRYPDLDHGLAAANGTTT